MPAAILFDVHSIIIEMNKISKISITSIACAILALLVAVIIFVLTSQSPEATSYASSTVNNFFVSLFGSSSSLYDSSTDLWLGINIRHWAHTAEFFVFGMFTTLAVWFAIKPRILATAGTSLLICLAFSLLDQCHKLFVPTRHFDGFDLIMDALGYGTVILIMLLVIMLFMHRKTDASRSY